jgi:hypothetical protein
MQMVEVPLKYQASFFGDITDIKASAETIPVFLEMFKDIGLLPSTFREFMPPSAPRVRLMLGSPDKEWEIRFASEQIMFCKNARKPKGGNLGTPEEFAKKVVEFCGRILVRFPKKAKRLALVIECLMPETSEEKLGAAYQCFLRPLCFYETNSPIEWKARSVTRIGRQINGLDEKLNVITDLSRVQGDFTELAESVRFDRIKVEFDINTFQGNVNQRFDEQSVSDFFPIALHLRSELLSEVEVLLNA